MIQSTKMRRMGGSTVVAKTLAAVSISVLRDAGAGVSSSGGAHSLGKIGQRIHGLAIVADFKVEVHAAGAARAPHGGDLLPLSNRLSFFNEDLVQVRVEGRPLSIVFDDDQVAITAESATCVNHHASFRGEYRRAFVIGQIDAPMGSSAAEKSPRETGFVQRPIEIDRVFGRRKTSFSAQRERGAGRRRRLLLFHRTRSALKRSGPLKARATADQKQDRQDRERAESKRSPFFFCQFIPSDSHG